MKRSRFGWMPLDLTTLLIGVLTGILPACLLVVLSYLYLDDLNPALLTAIQEPQLERTRERCSLLAETVERRRRYLVQDLAAAVTGEPGPGEGVAPDWDLVRSVTWYLEEYYDGARVAELAGSDPVGRSRGERLLEQLRGSSLESRGDTLDALSALPIRDLDPMGFSYGLEAVLFSTAAQGDSLVRQILRDIDIIDQRTLEHLLRAYDGRLRLSQLPIAIDVRRQRGPVGPGSTLARAESWWVGVKSAGSGTLALEIEPEPFLTRALAELDERAPVPDGLRFRLVRSGQDSVGDAQLWARWGLNAPFDRGWELWCASEGESQPLLLRVLRHLDILHYLYGGLLLLAFLTVGSLLFTGVLSRRVRVSRQKDDFVRLVSHELRTPIASIRMIAETLNLNRVRNDEERREFLDQLEEESLRLTDLIERVLEYGKSAGEREVVTDPEELVRAAVTRFRESIRGDASIEIRSAQEFHPVLLDREAITGVVYNLLSNARKYSPSDLPIEITVGEESRNLFIEVRDHGPGIRRRDLKKIFRPFYRGPGSSHARGFGLGLAYCQEVVSAHRGKIGVQSSLGEGCRFTVEIPTLRGNKE